MPYQRTENGPMEKISGGILGYESIIIISFFRGKNTRKEKLKKGLFLT
jgi:hypothetical protein